MGITYKEKRCIPIPKIVRSFLLLARHNLKSTIDFTWRQSIQNKLSPKQQMQYKKIMEKQQISNRNNELIKKRLKKEIDILDDIVIKKQKIDNKEKYKNQFSTINHQNSRQIQGKYYQRDFNQNHARQFDKQQNFNSNYSLHNKYTNNYNSKLNHNENKNNYQQYLQQSNLNRNQKKNITTQKQPNSQYPPQPNQNIYKRIFDPDQQSIYSRRSIANSQLSELSNKNNFIGKYLNKRLENYLISPTKSQMSNNFYDIQRQLVNDGEKGYYYNNGQNSRMNEN